MNGPCHRSNVTRSRHFIKKDGLFLFNLFGLPCICNTYQGRQKQAFVEISLVILLPLYHQQTDHFTNDSGHASGRRQCTVGWIIKKIHFHFKPNFFCKNYVLVTVVSIRFFLNFTSCKNGSFFVCRLQSGFALATLGFVVLPNCLELDLLGKFKGPLQ